MLYEVITVSIVDGTDGAGAFRSRWNVLGLFDGHRHGLFAQHVNASFEECLGNRVVGRIGRCDGDEINAVP